MDVHDTSSLRMGVMPPDFFRESMKMKSTTICVAVAGAVLWAGTITLAKDANAAKPTVTPKPLSEMKTTTTQTPLQRSLENAQRAHTADLEPWQKVLKIAEEEKATKTVAAIKDVIAAKEDAYKRRVALVEKQTAEREKMLKSRTNPTTPTKPVLPPPDKKPAEKK